MSRIKFQANVEQHWNLLNSQYLMKILTKIAELRTYQFDVAKKL